MQESGLCVKYPFEEATNVTRYSWFERSNLVAYEPGMRRRVSPKNALWSPSGTSASNKSHTPIQSCSTSPRHAVNHRDDGSSARDALSEDLCSMDDEMDGECDTPSKAGAARLPTVVVEHRWSFLFPRSTSVRATSQPDYKFSSRKAGDTITKTHSFSRKSKGNISKGCTSSDASCIPKILSVQEALTSPEFGGRSSVLRCLIMDMEMRFISRTQMNYAFHLSAIAERVVHQDVYHLTNFGFMWNPVISNEPIDVRCALKLTKLLKQPVAECIKLRGSGSPAPSFDGILQDRLSFSKHLSDNLSNDDRATKYQKLNNGSISESSLPVIEGTTSMNICKVPAADDHTNKSSGTTPPLKSIKCAPKERDLPEKVDASMLRAIYDSLANIHQDRLDKLGVFPGSTTKQEISETLFCAINKLIGTDCPDSLIHGAIASLLHFSMPRVTARTVKKPADGHKQLLHANSNDVKDNRMDLANNPNDINNHLDSSINSKDIKDNHLQLSVNSNDITINNVDLANNSNDINNHLESSINSKDINNDLKSSINSKDIDNRVVSKYAFELETRLKPFDPIDSDPLSDSSENSQQTLCDGTEPVDRFCLCRSKYVLCPTVFNEYIIFGGTPAIAADMEFGIWIFDTPFSRLKMRDVPVIYHQQVQYSSKKYIALADLNDAILSTRVLNLRLEFCGRGDWIYDDGTIPIHEGEKDRQVSGKAVTADDLMQLEFTGTVNQISKKFFLLQKSFLSTGKCGTSRLIFMDPYANIDASICDDKDHATHLADLLTVLYKHSPENFLASCNGYYYHEDGFLPEISEVQRVRNTLFTLESNHYRTAMLADIVAEQKRLMGLCNKMPFLTKCKRVIIGKSRIHGYGLFAVDTINKGELIMEYAGVVISDYMADMREIMYERLVCGSIYMFRLDLNHIIDSTFYGNCARFINHCCDPNTATTNFSYIDEEGFGTHVGIYASKVIPAGEEIYYNYRLSAGSANREICRCGSYMCTGYMSLIK
ncbi:SET domain-containing protein [Babesia ovis]|uniref:SET domain-containing protein n=1 Tax=Babesia ovis TaxID=5869 RepID=A0A9W5T8F0_BABOV|nr:SET domain-containing protein [Babesia ovis]